MPFAGYEDFESCVRQNQDAADPNAYCAAIQRQVEGKSDEGHVASELPADIQKIWVSAFREALEKNDESAAFKVAWATVLRRYEKTPNGKWAQMKVLSDIAFKSIRKQDRVIYGAASVAIVDSDNELITEEALKSAFRSYIDRGHVLFYHKNIPIGEVLPSYKLADGTELKSQVAGKELDIVVRIYKDTQIANEVWDGIETGELRAFSIGGQVIGDAVKVCPTEDTCYNRIDRIDLHEISIVPNPANDASYFTIIKSKVEPASIQNQEAAGADDSEAVFAAIKNRTVAHAKKRELAKSDEDAIKLVREWAKHPFSKYWIRKMREVETLITDEKTKVLNCPRFTEKALKILQGDDMETKDIESIVSAINALKADIAALKPKEEHAAECPEGQHMVEGECVPMEEKSQEKKMTEEKKAEPPKAEPPTNPTKVELESLRAQVSELTAAAKDIVGLKDILRAPTVPQAPVTPLADVTQTTSFDADARPASVVDWTERLGGNAASSSFDERMARIAGDMSGVKKVEKPKDETPKDETKTETKPDAETKEVVEPDSVAAEMASLRNDIVELSKAVQATIAEFQAMKKKAEIGELRTQVIGMSDAVKVIAKEIAGVKDTIKKSPSPPGPIVDIPATKRTVATEKEFIPVEETPGAPEVVSWEVGEVGNRGMSFEARMKRLAKEYGVTR